MNPEVAISIILSTHNRADYLPDALKALAAQKCRVSFEVIVIDNASTDNTPTILDMWCRMDSRFRTTREPRLGLSCGKNAGIRMARAPLLVFTDDDMVTDPQWLQSYHDLFSRQEDELVLAGGPCIPIAHDLVKWPDWFHDDGLADIALLHYHEERVLTKSEYVWGGNMAVPARLFARFGLWDETVGRKGDKRGTFEDTEFQDRIRQEGIAVWFCPSAAVHHRTPHESVTPRQISATAFTRGRNDFWVQNLKIWNEIQSIPKRNIVEGLIELTASLVRWSFWVFAFRLLRNRSLFRRMRRGAFASARSLETLRPGRDSTPLYFTASRITFLTRRLLLGLTPNVR